MQASSVASSDIEASTTPAASKPTVLHIVCDRDVGLFNLVQGVIPHTYYALKEGRIPIVYYSKNNCYWTPDGYRGRDTVWEYYFEPVIPEYPVSRIPPHVLQSIAENPPRNTEPGYFVNECAFVSNHGFWGINVDGEALRGPGTHEAPSRRMRELTSSIVRHYIRPRDYILEKVNRFFHEYMSNRYVIGVHIRGTDALGDPDRHVKMSSVNFRRYVSVLRRLLRKNPNALIFVASDEQASVDRIRKTFSGVIAYDSIRHHGGELAGRGPAGGLHARLLGTGSGSGCPERRGGSDRVFATMPMQFSRAQPLEYSAHGSAHSSRYARDKYRPAVPAAPDWCPLTAAVSSLATSSPLNRWNRIPKYVIVGGFETLAMFKSDFCTGYLLYDKRFKLHRPQSAVSVAGTVTIWKLHDHLTNKLLIVKRDASREESRGE